MGPTTYKSLKYLYHIYRDRYSKSLMDFLGPPLSRNGTVTFHRPDVSLGRVRADHPAPQRCTLRSPSTDPRDAPGLGGDGANLATDGIWRVAMAFLANDLYPKIHQAKLTFLLWGLKDDGNDIILGRAFDLSWCRWNVLFLKHLKPVFLDQPKYIHNIHMYLFMIFIFIAFHSISWHFIAS